MMFTSWILPYLIFELSIQLNSNHFLLCNLDLDWDHKKNDLNQTCSKGKQKQWSLLLLVLLVLLVLVPTFSSLNSFSNSVHEADLLNSFLEEKLNTNTHEIDEGNALLLSITISFTWQEAIAAMVGCWSFRSFIPETVSTSCTGEANMKTEAPEAYGLNWHRERRRRRREWNTPKQSCNGCCCCAIPKSFKKQGMALLPVQVEEDSSLELVMEDSPLHALLCPLLTSILCGNAFLLVQPLPCSLSFLAMSTCHWFLTALSVLPGKSLAISAHLFP